MFYTVYSPYVTWNMATAPHSLGHEEYCEIFISSDEENSNESDSESSTESDIDFKGLVNQSESESDLGKVQAKAVMKLPGCKILRTLWLTVSLPLPLFSQQSKQKDSF